jgi:hypothetical protein
MSNPLITIFDVVTGEITEREMTQEETAAHEAIIASSPIMPSPK